MSTERISTESSAAVPERPAIETTAQWPERRSASGRRRLRVTYTIDNLSSGGAQRQVAELAVHLRLHHGVDTSVVVYRPEDFHASKLRSAGVRLEHVERRSNLDPSFPVRLALRIRSLAPDVVHAFLLNPAFWSLLAMRLLPGAKRPVFVAGERSSLVATSRSLHLKQTLVFNGCDAITANAEHMVADLHERLGLARTPIQYVPNGIDLPAWTAGAALPPPWPIEPEYFHLALVGAYRPEKNHRLVLEALERLGPDRIRDWRVWFVGDPGAGQSFAAALRKRAGTKRLSGVVRLVPATRAIAPLMARMNGILLPSDFEGFPNVVLEAMALGVPVLATRVGDVPNLIEDGRTGLLLPRLDVDAMAAGLLRLHRLSPEERSAMGKSARDHVAAHFALDRVAALQLALYRRLLVARGDRDAVLAAGGEPAEPA